MNDNKALFITLGSMLAVAFLMFYVHPLWYGIRYGLSLMYNLGMSVFGDLGYNGSWSVFGYTWETLVKSTEVNRYIGETYEKAFFLVGAAGWMLSARLSIIYILVLLAGTIAGVVQ